MPVEFLVLHDIDLIVSHVENNMHIEEIQEGEDEDHDMEDPDIGNRFCDAHTLLPILLSIHKLSEISVN